MLAREWIEEMEQADKLVERIIFLDGFPNMQVVDPLHIGQNIKEVLDCDLEAECPARTLYEEAATDCHGVRDYVSHDLFEKLMDDEEEHIELLETQLSLVKDLGVESTRGITWASRRRQGLDIPSPRILVEFSNSCLAMAVRTRRRYAGLCAPHFVFCSAPWVT